MPKQVTTGERQWYAIHTYSGYEDSVARNLKQRVESLGFENKIFDVLVPKEKKIKIKGGKREIVEEKLYHGYVLVEMVVDDSSWYVVRNTPNVTGFIGAGADETGNIWSVSDNIPRAVIHDHLNQDVAVIQFFLNDFSFSALNLNFFLLGNQNIEYLVLKA